MGCYTTEGMDDVDANGVEGEGCDLSSEELGVLPLEVGASSLMWRWGWR